METHCGMAVSHIGESGLAYVRSIIDNNGSPLAKALISNVDSDTESFLIVHPYAAKEATQSAFHTALSYSPTVASSDGKLKNLVGINDINEKFAQYIHRILLNSRSFEFLVQDNYAKPSDFDKTSLTTDLNVDSDIFIDDESIYLRFDSCNSSILAIKRAIASMIPGYSVSWLISHNEKSFTPVLAIVSIFDGDGWIALGHSLPFSLTKFH